MNKLLKDVILLMKKVLHINSNYLTSKLHENLMDRLENEKFHNTIFMPMKKEMQGQLLYHSKHDVYHPIAFNNRDKFIFSYKQAKIYSCLEKQLDLRAFDLVHAHTLFTDGNIALKIKENYNIPYIVTVRGYTDIESFFKLRINLRKRGREILREASRVNFLSSSNKRELLDHYISEPALRENIEKKSSIIPNGIDDIYFERQGDAKKLSNKSTVRFIQVGKVMPLKNNLGSVQAVQAFKQASGREALYTYIGKIVKQDYFDKVNNLAPKLTHYLPAMPPAQLIELYRQNDIFIMPSFSETFGLVYPEAMSQGLPIIYTKGQGFDGQFQEGYVGYAVDPHNPDDIAEKIALIVENYTQISKNCLTAYHKFNWDRLSAQYLEIYNKALTSAF